MLGSCPFTGIYSFVHELINVYLNLYGDLSVTMGTIYDYNNDGLFENVTDETKYDIFYHLFTNSINQRRGKKHNGGNI